MEKIRILIVDDSQKFINSVVTFLKTQADFAIVGFGHNGHEGLSLAEKLCPEMVLLDVNMPGIDGFEVASRLRKSLPRTGIIITSTQNLSSYRDAAFSYDADDFIPQKFCVMN